MERVDSHSVPASGKAGLDDNAPLVALGGGAAAALRAEPPAPPAPTTTLAQKAAHGALWTIGTSVGSRACGLIGTLALTRFVTPEAYGEVSLAALVVQTAQVVSNCGFSQYIVSKPGEGREAAFHATFYYMLLGAIGLALMIPLSHVFGPLLGAPHLAAFVPGLVLAGLMERIATVQDRIQVRDMRFRSVGLLRSLGEVTYAVVTVALAIRGFGAAAVVWGSIVRSTVRLVGLSATTPWREWLQPCRITAARTRDFFRFGLPMSAATLAGFGSRRFDNFTFAGLFGAGAAGMYNLAYNLADIPATQIGETLGDVLVPSFAKMDSEERRRKALMLSMRIMTLLVAPLAVGLGVIAPTLIRAMYYGKDGEWAPVAPMLIVLAGMSVVRPIGWVASSYLQVKNLPRSIMFLEITKTVGLLAAMIVFGRLWGPLWACASVGVVFTFNSFGYLWIVRKIDGIPLWKQVAPLLPPVLACVPMAFAVVGVRHLLAGAAIHPLLGLIIEVAVGAVVFVPSALVISPSTSREFLNLLKSALFRRSAKAQQEAV